MLVKHKIDTDVRQSPRRNHFAKREVKNKNEEMKRMGIIEPIESL